MNNGTDAKISFFFPTRNRPEWVGLCLQSLLKFHPNSDVWVGNASAPGLIDKVSEIIAQFPKCHDVRYEPDPGTSFVYNDLFLKYVKTEYCVWLADDIKLLKELSHIIAQMDANEKLNYIGLPMIDDMSSLQKVGWSGWPKDEHGCAVWYNNGIRVGHHAVIRSSHFHKIGVANSTQNVDGFSHAACRNNPSSMIWPVDGAYLHHTRLLDETRINAVQWEGRFRLPLTKRKNLGHSVNDAADRDKIYSDD